MAAPTTRKPDDDHLPTGLTVDAFIAWAEGRLGRYELHAGKVYAMSPQRVGHAVVKAAVHLELARGIQSAGLPCHALPDGLTVRVDDTTAHEPDALVYCGERLDADATEVPSPIVVVEVLSPSTGYIDVGKKLANYFRVASVRHYVIVDPDGLPVVVHTRQADGQILTRITASGVIKLDPPGFDIDVGRFFN